MASSQAKSQANSQAKIVLSSSRDIPFNKLVLSQSNVRRIKAGLSIEELAESIERRGLIQSLHVRAVLDENGVETGMFEVPAGGRRYRALELLVKRKRLAKTAPVPCVVSEAGTGVLIDEISLAENLDRAPLHPLDQFRAFAAMREKGMSEEEIAAAFMVAVNVVKQRLRLATVSEPLLEVYAADGMTLEQLMAFTVSSDHARQAQVWEAIRDGWQKEPWRIRRMLTEGAVAASDRRAVFVGLEAYEAAGGAISRDLFQPDEGGWLEDAGLLDRLTAQKLKACAGAIAAEGWKWVETAASFPYGATQGLRRLVGEPVGMGEDETAARAALQSEYDRLCEEHDSQEELPDDVDARLGEIEAAIEALDDRPLRYAPDEIAIAGVFVSLDAEGALSVQRGYVRAGDEPDANAGDKATPDETGQGDGEADPQAPRPTASEAAGEAEEDREEGVRPLPDRLLLELTAHRTLALREAVAGDPRVAMTALLHKLATDAFLGRAPGAALEAEVRSVAFPAQTEGLNESAAATSYAARREAWEKRAPRDDHALWSWIEALDDEARMALLAWCVSSGVNALHEKPNPHGWSGLGAQGLKLRLAQADRLARASGLDMVAAGWRPTVDTYLGRVPKQRILEAVREGAGERAAQLIEHMKKVDMAREAERLLADTGWLPEPLRGAHANGEETIESADHDGRDDALPAFLAQDGDEEEPTDSEDDEESMIAAE